MSFIINPYRFATAGYTFRYLLDEFATDVHFAYALCLLDSGYAGNCIRVRESGGNTEADIGFDGDWLDESALLTHCGSNDGFIVTWYDQSGSARNKTQATTTAQPKIVNAGSVYYVNSRPAVYYTGAKKLALASYSGGATSQYYAVLNNNEDTSIAVGKGSDTGVYFLAFQNGSSSRPDQSVGTPSYYVNGASITATRDALYDNANGAQKLLSLRSLGLSGPYSSATIIDSYEFSTFEYGGYRQLDVMYHSHTEAREDIEGLINNNFEIY